MVVNATADKGRGVFALRDISAGEVVIRSRPVRVCPERTRLTIQTDFDVHVEVDEPGIFTNHSCDPNTGLRNNELGAYDFVALRDIKQGEEITWDYETTEFILIAVFECHCGSPKCRGRARGFKYLAKEVREAYGEFIGDYLKENRE